MTGPWSTAPRWKPSSPKPPNASACSTWTPATPEQANWAARHGLAASPYDERLYRVLMRAAHAAGNPAGVETLWQELLAVLGTDLDLVDEDLHPDTVALYTSLRGSRRPRPAQQGRHSTIPQN